MSRNLPNTPHQLFPLYIRYNNENITTLLYSVSRVIKGAPSKSFITHEIQFLCTECSHLKGNTHSYNMKEFTDIIF